MRFSDAFRIVSDLAARVRRAVVRLAGRGRGGALEDVRRELARAEPELAAAVADAQLLAYVRGGRSIARRPAVRRALPILEPVRWEPTAAGRSELWPQVAEAARSLAELVPATAAEFDRLDAEARAVAFTVARAQSVDAVRAVRDALAADVARGGTLREFRAAVAEELATSAVGPAQTEAIYRTHVGRAYGAGQVAVLDDPAVRTAVPYLLYSATHDSRTRPEHLAMESHGLDGTAVYRADDPVWDTFYPPWAWNCRCLVIPLGVEEAAELGVKEARDWKRTGRPPAVPQFVKAPPFRPPAGWVPTGRRLTPLV